jgi:SAM-dependent methyltransferase
MSTFATLPSHSEVKGHQSLPTRILSFFCRRPGTADYAMSGIHYEPGKELERLEEVFPDFRTRLSGKLAIDFGCGFGYQCAALALAGARQVIGIDIAEAALQVGRQRAEECGVGSRVEFARTIPTGVKADIIISQNSFEHFLDPEEVLAQLSTALAPGGLLFITFSPPWYAPWGAHMSYFCRLPWVHLFFGERTIMEVRSRFRSDGARSFRDAGLGELSLAKFEKLVEASRLEYQFRRYDCCLRLNWMQHTPFRELFVNRVSLILSGRSEPGAEC